MMSCRPFGQSRTSHRPVPRVSGLWLDESVSDLLRRAPRLREGDRVRLVSPASFPDRASVDDCLRALDGWGLRGEVAPHVFDEWGYMAGSDQARLDDLNGAFRDPAIRAVVATRGGAGAYRIADGLDVAAVCADPKPLVGFSDITYLHLSLVGRCRVGGIHGCLVGARAQASARQLLMTADPIVLHRAPGAVLSDVEVPGRVEGRLVGGNLAAVATSIGVRMPSMSGAILFLEDQQVVGLGTIDRQLTQLIAWRALEGSSAWRSDPSRGSEASPIGAGSWPTWSPTASACSAFPFSAGCSRGTTSPERMVVRIRPVCRSARWRPSIPRPGR